MEFHQILINWYRANKRDLPWRNTRNPYFIWLSEIILQQTRVEQGLPYYKKFVEEFPTIKDLAEADEEKVLKLWQGLGYYSRARNLHYTAKTILNTYRGKFPDDYKNILALRGIGEYTGAAIVSFAFDKPYAVVDGNVFRVLARFFGITTPIDSNKGKKDFFELAASLLDKNNPAEYNQAIMEFGAMQCVPKNPSCTTCPFNSNCFALGNKQIETLPVKSQKIKQRDRFFNYLVISSKNKLLLNKRTENDIWQNLYDFPLIETENRMEEAKLIQSEKWLSYFAGHSLTIKNISEEYKHVLSHQKIYAKFWQIEIDTMPASLKKIYTLIPFSKLYEYAVPKLVDNYLQKNIEI